MRVLSPLVSIAFLAASALAQNAGSPYPAPLPPDIPWKGASEAVIVPPTDPWVTPAELSGLTRTPTYEETAEWLRRLDRASEQVSMVSLGKSPEGRDIWMVIATQEKQHTREALSRSKNPCSLFKPAYTPERLTARTPA